MKYILAFLLLASAAFAGDTLCINVNKQECDQFGGCQIIQARGSGVVLSKNKAGDWVLITARHVVQNATAVHVGVDGQWVKAKSVHLAPDGDDAAFVVFASNADLKGTEYAEEDVDSGEIEWSGFSDGKKFETFKGRVTETGVAACPHRPKQGQSGGGVYDRHGRLIGVVVGYDSAGNLIYEPIGRIRRQCVRSWGFFFGIGIGIPIVSPPPPVVVVPPPAVYVRPKKPDAPMPLVPVPDKDASKAPPPPVEKPAETKPQPSANYQGQIDALNAEIRRVNEQFKYTQIPVKILRPDGTVFDEAKVRLDPSVPKDDPRLKDSKPILLKLAPVEKK